MTRCTEPDSDSDHALQIRAGTRTARKSRARPRACPSPQSRRPAVWSAKISYHVHLRYRHNELAAAFAVGALLRQNFIREIPRQQQSVVRHSFQQVFRRHDGKMQSRSKPSLFERAAVGDKFKRFAAKFAEIQ